MHGKLPLDPLDVRLALTHLLIPEVALQMAVEGHVGQTVARGRLALLVVGAEFPAFAAAGGADPDVFWAVLAAAGFEDGEGGGAVDVGEGRWARGVRGQGRDVGGVREGAVGWGDPG